MVGIPGCGDNSNAGNGQFEYTPALLTGAGGVDGVTPEAKDFAPATVVDAAFTPPDADNFVEEPNNVAAIDAITIYRSLRFGKHVELVMTDLRSYRSDQAIPEEFVAAVNTIAINAVGAPAFFAPRNALPLPLLNTLDQGNTANGGSPSATVPFGPFGNLPNPRAASPAGTMLGKQQKAWWKATMANSTATWKASPTPVACELVGPGISSNSLFSFFEGATRPPAPAGLRSLITVDASGTVDATGAPGSKFIENFNLLLRDGTVSAGTFAGAIGAGLNIPTALGAALAQGTADPTTNPHLQYVDSNSQGYCYAKVTADSVTASIMTINRPITTPTTDGPGIKRSATFMIPSGNPSGMVIAGMTGTKPFPLT